MADRASSSTTIAAAPADVMAVIADFERYPEWTSQVKTVEVLERDDAGRGTLVRFVVDAAGVVKDDYTLAYDWSVPDVLSWRLTAGQMQKAQVGSYTLVGSSGSSGSAPVSTEVRYDLSVDLAIPMIGLFKRKAEKTIIDTALKGLKARVESG